MYGVAPTVSGENRDSKVYGAEISWSCAQEGQNTPQTEVRFYLLLIVRCKGSFALDDDDDDKKMGCMVTNGTVRTRR